MCLDLACPPQAVTTPNRPTPLRNPEPEESSPLESAYTASSIVVASERRRISRAPGCLNRAAPSVASRAELAGRAGLGGFPPGRPTGEHALRPSDLRPRSIRSASHHRPPESVRHVSALTPRHFLGRVSASVALSLHPPAPYGCTRRLLTL